MSIETRRLRRQRHVYYDRDWVTMGKTFVLWSLPVLLLLLGLLDFFNDMH